MAKLAGPIMLAILDGFGIGDCNNPNNAIAQANPQTFKTLWDMYPHSQLQASGLDVGLPNGQMGNSEVGHLNIGAGRIVYQELTRITKEMEEGTFFEKSVVKKLYGEGRNHRLHLICLLSDGGVHSHILHLKSVIKGAKEAGVTEIFVHALLDGRDVPPKSALTYIADLEGYMELLQIGSIATVGGRYYGMDRDNRWDRVELAYQAMVNGVGKKASSAAEAVEQAYSEEITDEFVIPTIINQQGLIQAHDAVLFCNFRPDRARQLTRALGDSNFTGFERQGGFLPLFMATMTVYEERLPVEVVYRKERIKNPLGEVLSKGGYNQLRIAETEKYAHVTYFFNGGEEVPFENEDRILIASPKVATYDLQPEMSAPEVTNRVIEAIQSEKYDVIILNFANSDMVGHTGVLEAAKKAVLAVDACLAKIVPEILAVNGHLLITADHGNSEVMVDSITGAPHTAHTTNPVPLVLISDMYKTEQLEDGRLCDLAPTILDLAHIPKPVEMTGVSLLKK